MCVLVVSPNENIASIIRGILPADQFRLVVVRPGLEFMEAVRREQPEIAVIHWVHERIDAVQMEIAVLKEVRAEVRIIALSEQSSDCDGSFLEQGVFYYMTTPPGPELARVIAAARLEISDKER